MIFILFLVFTCACISNTPGIINTPEGSPVSTSDQIKPATGEENTIVPTAREPQASAPVSSHDNGTKSSIPEVSLASSSTVTMEDFIALSYPQITELYVTIKKSRDALQWKEVQDSALQLQLLIQEFKKTYRLDIPNPEKKVFGPLDSRKEIILLKYLEYMNDMESYATNLKNAVYYQEKGSDPGSAQTARRYQGQADQYMKQAIAEVKTINEYCDDFQYSFFDTKLVQEYRYTDKS